MDRHKLKCDNNYNVKSHKDPSTDWSPLSIVVQHNKQKGSSKCLKIMGYITYFCHKFSDNFYLNNNKYCNHEYLCICKQNLLKKRNLDQPFLETPIWAPHMIDGKIVKPSTRDSETLVRIGLHNTICRPYYNTSGSITHGQIHRGAN